MDHPSYPDYTRYPPYPDADAVAMQAGPSSRQSPPQSPYRSRSYSPDIEHRQQSSSNSNGRAPPPAAPPLPRNSACQPCKSKKLRCDAGKPHCRTCINTYQYKKQRASRSGKAVELNCWYAEAEAGGPGTGSSGSAGAMRSAGEGRRSGRRDDDRSTAKGAEKDKDKLASSELLELKELRELKDRMAQLERMMSTNASQALPPVRIPDVHLACPAPLDDLATLAASYHHTPPLPVIGHAGFASFPSPFASMASSSLQSSTGRNVNRDNSYRFQDVTARSEDDLRMAYDALPSQAPPPPPPVTERRKETNQVPAPQVKVGVYHHSAEIKVHPFLEGYVSPTGGWKRSPDASMSSTSVKSPASLKANAMGIGRSTNNIVYPPEFGTIQAPGPASIDSLLNPSSGLAPGTGQFSLVGSPEDNSPGGLGAGSRGHSGSSGPPTESVPMDDLPTGVTERILLDVFWPGWPVDLCEPGLMDHLIEIFFNHAPSIPRMIHRERFLTRMANPPTHSSFPSAVLLHAICAVASLYSPRVYADPEFKAGSNLNGEADDPRRIADFGERHAAITMRLLERKTDQGQIIYANTQAMQVLVSFYHYKARWLDAWNLTGNLTRQVGPLGLNMDLERDGGNLSTPMGVVPGLLPPPIDHIEREERRALLWMIVGSDIGASSGSGWTSSLALDEISAPLCCAVEDFENNVGQAGVQTMLDADFYSRHPAEDSFVMHIKTCILLGQVNKLFRRAKLAGIGTANMDEHRQLDESRRNFLATFPRSLRDPLTPPKGRQQKAIDTDLFAAHVVLHQIGIALHEPTADIADPTNRSTQTLLAAARGILNLVYLAISTNFDMCYLVRCQTGFYTSARVLHSFFEYAMHKGGGYSAAGSAADIKVELEVIRLVFSAQSERFPLGQRYAKMLEHLLNSAIPCAWSQSSAPS